MLAAMVRQPQTRYAEGPDETSPLKSSARVQSGCPMSTRSGVTQVVFVFARRSFYQALPNAFSRPEMAAQAENTGWIVGFLMDRVSSRTARPQHAQRARLPRHRTGRSDRRRLRAWLCAGTATVPSHRAEKQWRSRPK